MEKIKIELANLLTKEIGEIFNNNNSRTLQSNLKDDQSIVTEIDLLVSNYLKNAFSKHPEYKTHHFYSEEDYHHLQFPCAVIDPIDGTRELARGRAECAVSVAMMSSILISDPLNYAWIYNPFSGFSLDTNMPVVISNNHSVQKISGMVSRSEFAKDFYKVINNPKIQINPRGSIAFKLGLLSAGACDFVVSKFPKNIWDIAAGTILANQRGYNFYLNGELVTSLDREKYNGVLIWAKEVHIQEIWAEFQK